MIALRDRHEQKADLNARFVAKGPFNRVLYVGAKVQGARHPSLLDAVRKVARTVECLELYAPNVEALRTRKFFDVVYQGDIREWYPAGALYNGAMRSGFDLLLWWHGPEHLPFVDAITLLARLASARPVPALAIACPYGLTPQGAVGGNPHEKHACGLLPEDFERLGFTVSVCGRPNKKGGNILATMGL